MYGSWLNIAGIELNVMTRQCLSRRIGDMEQLQRELACWEANLRPCANSAKSTCPKLVFARHLQKLDFRIDFWYNALKSIWR